MRNLILLVLLFSFFFSCSKKNTGIWLASAPAKKAITKINIGGKTVIPNGRFVTPVGKTIITAPHPFGMTISPDGNTVVTANSGISPLSITIIRNVLSDHPDIQQIPPGEDTDKGVLASVFMGLAISPDSKTVYVAGGQENKIYLFDLANGDQTGAIDCSFLDSLHDYTHGYIGDLALTKDGKTLYAVDQIGFRVVVIDVKHQKIKHSVPVGRYPFGICLSPDEKKVHVANVGMFEYSFIRDVNDTNKVKLIDFPAFEYGSEEMRKGYKNDSVIVKGLGNPNAIEAFSVFVIDVSNQPKVIAKIKTGHQVGTLIEDIPAVGGSSPNSIVATDKYVFISNGNNDNISVISTETNELITHISLIPDKRLRSFRGVIPFGLALSEDKKRLFVAEAGINAVGVIDIADFSVKGHIPTGWFPSKMAVYHDQLFIANAKGYGSGPNGGKTFDLSKNSYIGYLMKGTLQITDIPTDDELPTLTKQVIDNNFLFRKTGDKAFAKRKNPIPLFPGEKKSPIKHIVFISKENRTYDEIFGQLNRAKGDPTLARYGKDVAFRNTAKTDSLEKVTVMPNHLKLATEFAFSDNFYVDADVSVDGHKWLVNTYPNEWAETCTAASYGGNRNFKSESKAPGVFAMNGAAGAIYPEEYNEAGSMWDHLARNDKSFYNFGFSIMFEPAVYKQEFTLGLKQYINYPTPDPLYNNTSRLYPTYNTAIPDQFRIDRFEKEFTDKWLTGKDTLPDIITVIIPNDHGAGDRPEAGYPFRESYMADNDLATGRIVEFLSHTRYWKNMLIIITEDDAQNGVDHIDAHRSVLMAISPWVKRQHVSSFHYSFGSIFKTFWNILGMPYLNQYDAGATDLSDFFTSQPDFKPYNAVMVDKRMFNPQKALTPFDADFDWKALEEAPEMDNVKDMQKLSKEQDKDRLENRR